MKSFIVILLLLFLIQYVVYGNEDCDDQGVCFSSDPVPKTSKKSRKSRKSDVNCFDKQPNCRDFKSRGKCQEDPGWMTINCGRTCKYCHLQDQMVRCNRAWLNISTVPAYPPGGLYKMFSNISKEIRQKYSMMTYSVDPWVVTFDNFLTESEADELLVALERSGNPWSKSLEYVGASSTGDPQRSEQDKRTSSSAWCEGSCKTSKVARAISKKIEEVVQIPNVQTQSEAFQLIRYQPGQKYGPHHDITPAQKYLACGPRILTFFLYLNDVEEGGETSFPKLDITIKPKKGRAALWHSVLNTDLEEMDHRTTHEAKPVTKGMKYAANSWIHLYNFDQSYKWGCCWI